MTHFSRARVAGIVLLGWSLTAPVYAENLPTPVAGPATQAPAPRTPTQGQTAQGPKDKGGKKNSGSGGTTPPK